MWSLNLFRPQGLLLKSFFLHPFLYLLCIYLCMIVYGRGLCSCRRSFGEHTAKALFLPFRFGIRDYWTWQQLPLPTEMYDQPTLFFNIFQTLTQNASFFICTYVLPMMGRLENDLPVLALSFHHVYC